MYYVYVLKSQSNGKLYKGHTNDIDRRFDEHDTGGSPYTRGRGPWELIGWFPCKTRSEAMRLENKLKRMKRSDRVIDYLTKHGILNKSK